ncbi:hypothetical protein H5410_061097, partial [Solanum commersonii]
KLFVRVDFYYEWIVKKNRYIWHWKDGKKQSVGMAVKRNILYDDFMNLIIHSCGLNFQPKDFVIGYIPVFFIIRSQQDMLNDEFDGVDINNHDDEIEGDEVSDLRNNNPPTPIIGRNNPTSSQ